MIMKNKKKTTEAKLWEELYKKHLLIPCYLGEMPTIEFRFVDEYGIHFWVNDCDTTWLQPLF